MQERQEPLEWMRTFGRELALIRPSSRQSLVVPQSKEEPLLLAAPQLAQERKARYHSYGQEPETGREQGTRSKTATAKKREKKKEEAAIKQARGAKGEGKGERPADKRKGSKARGEEKSKEKKSERGREKERRREAEKKKELQSVGKEGLPQFSG